MMKQNPFSLYDFLGYLIPGSLLIYAYLTINHLKDINQVDFSGLLVNFSKLKFDEVFFFIIASYSLGHLLSFLSSVTIEKYANLMYDYPSKYLLGYSYNGYWGSANSWEMYLWRGLLIIILLPLVLFDLFLGRLLRLKDFYQGSLDPLLKNLVKFKVSKLLGKLGGNEILGYNSEKVGKYDFHRIVTHYTFENSKNHQSRMTNYVALFGFLRNLSLFFNILAWYYALHIAIYSTFNVNGFIVCVILMLISYLFFMAFMKFYRRYTLEGFMLIAVDENLK